MSDKISQSLHTSTFLTLFVCYLPHWLSSPLWLNSIVAAIFLIHAASFYQAEFFRNCILRFLLLIAGILGLVSNLGGITQGDFFIQLFILFFFLKSMELRSLRDYRVVALGALYLILTALLLEQALWLLVWIFIAVASELVLLLKLTSPQAKFRHLGKISGKTVLLAVPFAMLLFFVFPRLGGPLWQMPSVKGGEIGFQDSLELGSISELFFNETRAMRVSGNRQDMHKLYWRGAILSDYDGLRWTTQWFPSNAYAPLPSQAESETNFEILLEPTGQKWLFFVGQAVAGSPRIYFNRNSGLVKRHQQDINHRFRYQVSVVKPEFKALEDPVRQRNLWIPPKSNPRLQAYGKRLADSYPNNIDQRIVAIGDEIQKENFWYRLNPKTLSPKLQQLDTFWFDTQEGYCEHYASAVTVILRAANIPARIVIGYYGGEWNATGDYLNIKQGNAHAWLEFWKPAQGWTRLDPVTFIPRERIAPDILERERLQEEAYAGNYGGGIFSWWRRQVDSLESTQYFLEKWLLFYNQDAQNNLMQRLGFEAPDVRQLFRFFIGVVIFLIAIGGILFYISSKRQSRLAHEILKWHECLRRHQIQTDKYPSFTAQCRRLQNKFPKKKNAIQQIYVEYETLRLKSSQPLTRKKENALIQILRRIRRLIK